MPSSEAPGSSTSLWVNATALPTFLAMVWLLRRGTLALPDPALALACSLGVALIPMVLLDLLVLKVHRRASSGLDFAGPRRPLHLARIATKLCGLGGTLAVCALLYWVLPEYQKLDYQPFFRLALASIELLLLLAVFYFGYLDGRMVVPEDGYFHAGSLLLGQWRAVDWNELRRHALAWGVKGFFLPIMFVGMLGNFSYLLEARTDPIFTSYRAFHDLAFELCFTIDLLHAVIGYLLTCRLIDAQIRSTDPTTLGWLVTLICYMPFFGALRPSFLEYDDGLTWGTWLASSPTLYGLWGSAILLLHLVYAIASLCFGCRFSNLTYRGVLTRGPYRWTKHPAYLSKNLAWWLISIPFISHEGWSAAVRSSLVLLLLNLIYFARARTEERHLSAFPEYVEYGRFMNEHGALRGLGRLWPALRYRPPEGT
jgi:protein-S-isoprenylcysteine O-methyltransferase Ste14